jgi:hypothetical protein
LKPSVNRSGNPGREKIESKIRRESKISRAASGDGKATGHNGIHRTKMSHQISSSAERGLFSGYKKFSRHAMIPVAILRDATDFSFRPAPPSALACTCRRGGGIPPGSGAGDP